MTETTELRAPDFKAAEQVHLEDLNWLQRWMQKYVNGCSS
jgi:hypothetical protein